MIDLSSKSYISIETRGGRSLFMITDKADDAVEIATTAARALEQIESNPGQMADLSKHGVVSIALGIDAVESIQTTLRDLR